MQSDIVIIMAILPASDLVNAIILARFVISASTATELCSSSPILILCYFSEVITSTGSYKFKLYDELVNKFKEIVGDVRALESLRSELEIIKTGDEFSTEIDTIRKIIEPNVNLSFNGLAIPAILASDSFLGIFIRSVIVQWDCLRFEEVCSLFDQFQCFLRGSSWNNPITRDYNDLYRFVSILPSELEQEYQSSSRQSYLVGDIRKIEDSLHNKHDGMNRDIILPHTDGSGPTGVVKALHDLLHSDDVVEASMTSHQHAMLKLASMWKSTDNFTMALSAVEEALKTAHQRGDHTTVAHALFLLHGVFTDSHDLALIATAEDVLVRCLKRCAALNMQDLTAQAALLLAQLRSKQPFRWSALPEEVSMPSIGSLSTSSAGTASAAHWKLSEIWSQINFALLGEISLTNQILTSRRILEDSEFTQSASGAGSLLGPTPASQHAKKDNQQEVSSRLSPAHAQLVLQAGVLNADIWARAGMLSMAELSLRRVMRSFNSRIHSAEDVIPVYCKLLYIQTKQVWELYRQDVDATKVGQQKSSDLVLNALSSVLDLGKRMKNVFSQAHPVLLQTLETALVYVLYHRAAVKGELQAALRLAHRLVEATEGIAVAVGSVSSTPPRLTEDQLRARLLLCEAIAPFDFSKALQGLAALSAQCAATNCVVWQYQCLSSQGALLLKYGKQTGNHEQIKQGVAILTDVAKIARHNGYNAVLQYTAQVVSYL